MDRVKFARILVNLVSNAFKFTPAGGSVTITLDADGPDLDLAVSDTGVGIAPQDLKRLGRPFEQAGGADQKAQGTGLGLCIAHKIVEAHGGSLEIHSAPGQGTRVCVRLPRASVVRARAGRSSKEA